MIECGEVNLTKADFSAFKYVFQCEYCGDDFGANRRSRVYCNEVCSENHRKKEMRTPEKLEKAREARRKYRLNKPEKVKESRDKYRIKNPEMISDSQKSWAEKNKEILYQKAKKWRDNNPDKVKDYMDARKEREKIKKSQLATLDAISQIRNNNLINSTGETK